jgi:hypothetical protein
MAVKQSLLQSCRVRKVSTIISMILHLIRNVYASFNISLMSFLIKEWSHTNIIKIICLFVCLFVCLFICLVVVGGASQKRYSNHLIIIRLVSSRIFLNYWAHVKYNKLTSRCYKSTLLRYATCDHSLIVVLQELLLHKDTQYNVETNVWVKQSFL